MTTADTRCPACGAVLPRDGQWCTLCFLDLRPAATHAGSSGLLATGSGSVSLAEPPVLEARAWDLSLALPAPDFPPPALPAPDLVMPDPAPSPQAPSPQAPSARGRHRAGGSRRRGSTPEPSSRTEVPPPIVPRRSLMAPPAPTVAELPVPTLPDLGAPDLPMPDAAPSQAAAPLDEAEVERMLAALRASEPDRVARVAERAAGNRGRLVLFCAAGIAAVIAVFVVGSTLVSLVLH